MSRYDDVRSMGRSRLAPYAETHEERAHNREEASEAHEEQLRRSLAAVQGSLEIKNRRQHWIIRLGKQRAEWWPRSAKLVIDQRWDRGVHAHDVEQVMKALGVKAVAL